MFPLCVCGCNCVGFMLCGAVLGVLSSLAMKRAGMLLCVVAVYVLCLFLTVLWVGLQSMVVSFPCHIHVLISSYIFLCVWRVHVILYEIRGLNIIAHFKKTRL